MTPNTIFHNREVETLSSADDFAAARASSAEMISSMRANSFYSGIVERVTTLCLVVLMPSLLARGSAEAGEQAWVRCGR